MYLFHNDYNQMCHPAILERMTVLQHESMTGYGMDEHCHKAADYIRRMCEKDDVSIHFLVGGTQTNLTVIAAALRPHQAVLAAHSGHINVHETGAIEATGHKVVSVASGDGKINAQQILQVARAQENDENAEHAVQIKMVYISNSTELGTTYTLAELEAISEACKQSGFYLFLDGARLGYALTAKGNDISLANYARLCDVFYIGGTKCGAMFGEAVVIADPNIDCNFRYIIKQRGAMLAKGWLLGLQFEVLFENNLYFDITAQANEKADRIRKTLSELNYPLLVPGNTNQVFPILPNSLLDILSDNFTFLRQETIDDGHTAVRFCTSWATGEEEISALCQALRSYNNGRI